MWLAITTLLGVFAGWFELQRLYPDRDEEPSDKLRSVSGAIGRGSLLNPWGNVSYGSCLTLEVCYSGLRVRVWRIFAVFQKPIFVPWPCIEVQEKRVLFLQRYRLEFARTGGSALTISERAFRRIAEHGSLKYQG
jgi:hypothetical protein